MPTTLLAVLAAQLLLCLLRPTIGLTEDRGWLGDEIRLHGLSERQLEILQDTLERMGDLEKSDLRINEKVYARLSRFEPLFGFQFEGEALRDWLLSRIRSIRSGESWTVAVNRGKGRFVLGKAFFEELSPLERIYLLVHEARHSDGDGYPHVRCPRGFKFISAAQPEMDLEHEKACDSSDAGAYAFQAALLFELYAFGLFDQREVGSIYNSSVSRVLE